MRFVFPLTLNVLALLTIYPAMTSCKVRTFSDSRQKNHPNDKIVQIEDGKTKYLALKNKLLGTKSLTEEARQALSRFGGLAIAQRLVLVARGTPPQSSASAPKKTSTFNSAASKGSMRAFVSVRKRFWMRAYLSPTNRNTRRHSRSTSATQ
jgi:hypothetical protein